MVKHTLIKSFPESNKTRIPTFLFHIGANQHFKLRVKNKHKPVARQAVRSTEPRQAPKDTQVRMAPTQKRRLPSSGWPSDARAYQKQQSSATIHQIIKCI